MKALIVLWVAGFISFIIGSIIWYAVFSAKYISRFSEIVSVRTVNWVRNYNFLYFKMFWDKTVKTVCYWRCRNYSSSSSSWWSSSRGGGK